MIALARRVLAIPAMFNAYQAAVGANHAKSVFVNEWIRPIQGDSLLDIGCGTGAIIPFLPTDTHVTGVDIDAAPTGGRRGEEDVVEQRPRPAADVEDQAGPGGRDGSGQAGCAGPRQGRVVAQRPPAVPPELLVSGCIGHGRSVTLLVFGAQ